MTGKEFVNRVCEQLVRSLTANDDVLGLTSNPTLKGGFAEASVRQFIARFVYPLHISRGTIVYEGNCGGQLPELDAIIWQPCPLPAILEAGDFAFVPRIAALGYIEIKRSNYPRVGAMIRASLDRENDLVPVVEGENEWKPQPPARALGVVCLCDENNNADRDLDDLAGAKKVAVLLRKPRGEADYRPDSDGVLLLASFLMGIRLRARLIDGKIVAKLPGGDMSA